MATVPVPEDSLRRSKPTSRELAFIIGVPAAWAILLLFHPLGGDSFYETIDGNVTAWITVHLGMGVFVPLFAGVVYLLLRGLQGTAATIALGERGTAVPIRVAYLGARVEVVELRGVPASPRRWSLWRGGGHT